MQTRPYGLGNYRWQMLALLFFATTINYIDRQVIGILKPYIATELGWNETDYGLIITAFQLAYAIGLLTTGRFLDRVGTRLGYIGAMIVWSLAAIAHAAASGVRSFMIVRFLLGLGESANFPAAVKSVAEWFPRKDRAFATGWFNSGSTVGAILAPVLVSAITVSLGWRMAFVVTGAIGFIWLALWWRWYQHPAIHKKITRSEYEYIHQDEASENSNTSLSWWHLFRYKQTFAICATRFVSDWVWWFFLFWIPDFIARTAQVNIQQLVMPLIVIYLVSSLGGIGGGWLSSHFLRQGRSIDFARKRTILWSALLVLPVMLVPHIGNFWILVLLIALAAAGHQSWASNIFTLVSDIYPKNAVASMVGLSGFTGAIGGALSASFVGLILDATHSYFLIFTVASSVYLLNWLIIRVFIPEIKPLRVDLLAA